MVGEQWWSLLDGWSKCGCDQVKTLLLWWEVVFDNVGTLQGKLSAMTDTIKHGHMTAAEAAVVVVMMVVVLTVGPEEEEKSSNSCNFKWIMNIYMILLNINLIINFDGSSLHVGLNERNFRQKPQNCERWKHLHYMFISDTVSCDKSTSKNTIKKCSTVSLHSNIKN
jgi:hypothetical protein